MSKLQEQSLLVQQELFKLKCMETESKAPETCIFTLGLTAKQMSYIANQQLKRGQQLIAVFSYIDQNRYQYFVGSENLNVQIFIDQFHKICPGQGSGSENLTQGIVFASKQSIKDACNKILQLM